MGVSLIQPTSHRRTEAQIRSMSRALYFNNQGAYHGPDRAVATAEQRGDPAQYPPHPPGGRHQKQEETQSCSLQKRDHTHRNSGKMRSQRNMLQMREQDKNLQGQLNEEKIGNLPEKEFRVIIKMM